MTLCTDEIPRVDHAASSGLIESEHRSINTQRWGDLA